MGSKPLVKNFTQLYGVNYFETFSFMICLNYICILLVFLVNARWPIFKIDIKNKFLNGYLSKEVYMYRPFKFITKGEYLKVCKLNKVIYDLK